MMLVIPENTTDELTLFAKKIDSASSVLKVRVEVDVDAKSLDCFENVKKYIEKNGGTAQHGWRVAELPGFFLEAEFHTIWVSPEGDYLDISSQQIPTNHTMFILDTIRAYDGRQVCNEFYPLRKSNAIDKYINATRGVFEYMNKGDKAYYVGEVKVDDMLRELMRTQQSAFLDILREWSE